MATLTIEEKEARKAAKKAAALQRKLELEQQEQADREKFKKSYHINLLSLMQTASKYKSNIEVEMRDENIHFHRLDGHGNRRAWVHECLPMVLPEDFLNRTRDSFVVVTEWFEEIEMEKREAERVTSVKKAALEKYNMFIETLSDEERDLLNVHKRW
jgi:hypothetical protein